MSRFEIFHSCLKVPNKGIILSLGGDDNCRGDDHRDRLGVLFHDENHDVIPDWLTGQERNELVDRKELDVWARPERFASLLQRHMAQ